MKNEDGDSPVMKILRRQIRLGGPMAPDDAEMEPEGLGPTEDEE